MRKIPLALLCARGVFLFHTELFFFSHGSFLVSHGIHGIHGNADASPAEDTISDVVVSHGSFLVSHGFVFSLTECTDITEMTLRVLSGFEFSPTDCTD